MTDTYDYGPYGELLSHTGTSQVDYLYNGRDGVITDSEDLYYMRARYYSTDLRRFLSEDSFAGKYDNILGMNLYGYVNGNPVQYVDPSGQIAAKGSASNDHDGLEGVIWYASTKGTGKDKVYAIPLTDANRLTQEQQEANATYIYNYLSDKCWTTEAIAGLLGNIQQESQMNPGVWQRQDNTNLGYGLVQWDDATKFLDAKNLSVDGANKLAQK